MQKFRIQQMHSTSSHHKNAGSLGSGHPSTRNPANDSIQSIQLPGQSSDPLNINDITVNSLSNSHAASGVQQPIRLRNGAGSQQPATRSG